VNYQDLIDSQFNEKQVDESNINKQSVIIKDESLIKYYSCDLANKEIKPFLLQRIDDSTTYIVLFATGLLLMMGTNPLTL
jgi:hypothetical protein